MQQRIDIQLLRALAVIFVVLFHLEISGIESGFLGVDVFFVVSGFLMAILYKSGETKKFFERRAKRLIPAYFATVILTLIASLFLVLPSELGQVVDQSIYSLFFASNFGFWMQNSYFSKADFNPLLHLWSLGVEIQFYLIVPLLVWFFNKSKAFLFLALLSSFFLCIYIVGISTKTSFFMMPLRMWEFLIGFVVAYYLTNDGNVKFKNFSWLGVVGLVALCAIPFIKVDGSTLDRLQGHPSFYALAVCIATSLVLGFGLPKAFENNRVSRFLAKIGDYSYSIYLVHFPIIVLYLYEPFSGTNLHPETVLDKLVLFVMIVVASVLMHKLIETRRFNKILPAYALSLVSVFVLAGFARITPNLMYDNKANNVFNGLSDRSYYRCGKMIRITDPSAISCKINDEEFENSVLLVGNSHADSIKIAFSETASKKNLNTYFLVSNTPLMDSSVTVDALLAEAKRLNINKIVLHYSPNSLKAEILKDLIAKAKHQSTNIELIMPVPVYESSVPKMVYANDSSEAYKIDKYLTDNSEFIQAVNKYDRGNENFKAHNTVQIFCNKDCKLSDSESRPYYFDSNHLNLTGANLLKPIISKSLE